MILATFDQNRDHKITGYKIKGHSGYAEAGSDIICSAVSVLAINTANAIETLLGQKVIAYQEDGLLECSFPNPDHEGVQLLLNTLILGIEQISQSYGDRYVRIKIK